MARQLVLCRARRHMMSRLLGWGAAHLTVLAVSAIVEAYILSLAWRCCLRCLGLAGGARNLLLSSLLGAAR